MPDVILLSNYLFQGGPAPFPSPLMGDVNCDGQLDLADVQYLTNALFLGGPPIVSPCFEFGD
ncbi:hypothetical protein GF420_15215 [candidate division GN15 bacterium]|nr:hypothetical protein [candidate division GN15 bacterium]